MTADKLRAWRAAIGLTQESAARALRISTRAYARYESGTRRIPGVLDLACDHLTEQHAKATFGEPNP